MFARVGHFAALEQHIEIGPQSLDGRLQALELLRHVVGDEIRDHHPRLVQHHVAERDAFAERRAGEVERAADRGLEARFGDRGELAGRDHLCEHHRGGL